MSKRDIAFLGGTVALLVAIILPMVTIYIATIAPEEDFFILYFGLSGLAFVFISISLFRWGHKLLMAEQLQKLLESSNN